MDARVRRVVGCRSESENESTLFLLRPLQTPALFIRTVHPSNGIIHGRSSRVHQSRAFSRDIDSHINKKVFFFPFLFYKSECHFVEMKLKN